MSDIFNMLHLCEPIAKNIRNEDQITGNRIILVKNNGEEEQIEHFPNLTVNFKGKNGLLKIHEDLRIDKKCLAILGEKSYIHIQHKCLMHNTCLLDMGHHNSTLFIGHNSYIRALSIFAAAEPNIEVIIGHNFLSSLEVTLRPSDGHTIFSLDEPDKPINAPVFGIHIGNHVWVGQRVLITKDAHLPDDCIVGSGAIVGRKNYPSHSIIGGIPAKVIKTGVSWNRKTIFKFLST